MVYNASMRKSTISNSLSNPDYTTDYVNRRFYFSSHKHKEKFDNLLMKRVFWLEDSLSKRFHVNVRCEMLAAIQLYMMVEGRGFKIEDLRTGVVSTSTEDVSFEVRMTLVGGDDE